MSLGRDNLESHYNRILCGILVIVLLAGLIPIGSTSFLSKAAAEDKEFEVRYFSEKFTKINHENFISLSPITLTSVSQGLLHTSIPLFLLINYFFI